jgi:hypothetical protein
MDLCGCPGRRAPCSIHSVRNVVAHLRGSTMVSLQTRVLSRLPASHSRAWVQALCRKLLRFLTAGVCLWALTHTYLVDFITGQTGAEGRA